MFRVHEMPFKCITGVANVEIDRYALVTIASDGCVKPAGAGDYVVGITRQAAKKDQEVTIMVHGVSYVKAAVKLLPGAQVKATTGGAITAVAVDEKSNMIVIVGAEANEIACVLMK